MLLGAGVVAGAYAVGKALLPDHPQIALGAAALRRLSAAACRHARRRQKRRLAELIVALTLWGIVVYLKSGRVKAWQLGVLVGLGLLTKVSTIFLAGLVPLAILLKWWIKRDPTMPVNRPVQTALGLAYVKREGTVMPFEPLRRLVAFGVPALILGGVWWVRDLSVYGFPDLFGLGRHNLVVADQLRTADYIAQLGVGEYLRRGLETTFNSFWGQFGWMALPLANGIYTLILIFLVVTAVGWIVGSAATACARRGSIRTAGGLGDPEPDGAAGAGAVSLLQHRIRPVSGALSVPRPDPAGAVDRAGARWLAAADLSRDRRGVRRVVSHLR